MVLIKFHKNKISQYPLIKIEDILKIYFNNFKNKEKNYLEYIYNSYFCVFYNRSTFSIYKLYEFSKQITQNGRVVFIPDFICNESLSILRQTDAQLVFYDHSHINTKNLISKMKNNNANIFLFVNYFGRVTKLSKRFTNFIKEKNILLIEDSTHCLYSYSNNCSDVEIFSPYKQYGIPDGSVIRFKDKKKFYKFIFNKQKNNYLFWIKCIQDYGYFTIYLMKKYIRYLFGYKYEKVDFNRIINHPKFIGKSINFISLKLLNIYAKRIDYYKIKRTENYFIWKRNLYSILPFINMEKLSFVPYLCLIKFNNNSKREKILQQYNTFGLPLCNWPDLPPEIIKSKLYFKAAKEKAKNQLTLPVHQDITESMINECIKTCFEKYVSTFNLSYSKKNNKIKVYELGKLVGNIIILFNPITNQNILKLEFNKEFTKTYNYSINFFFKLSIEFIKKININEIIYIPNKFYDCEKHKIFRNKGIKDNIIPLSLNKKDINNFLLSFFRIICSTKKNDITKENSIKIEKINNFENDNTKNIVYIKLRMKTIAKFYISPKKDHIILENINIFENYYSLDQYILYLCIYYKNDNFDFLKIKNNSFSNL
tara:strand:+ start:15 stop:1802 length:1788 start_codon:yes stop_codon:yes gene_type:complete